VIAAARNIAARLAHRIDAAQHHIIDQRRIELVALADGGQRMARQRQRRHLMQGSIGLAATAGRADMIEDEGIHGRDQVSEIRNQGLIRQMSDDMPVVNHLVRLLISDH
jgi:hypothetical protein